MTQLVQIDHQGNIQPNSVPTVWVEQKPNNYEGSWIVSKESPAHQNLLDELRTAYRRIAELEKEKQQWEAAVTECPHCAGRCPRGKS